MAGIRVQTLLLLALTALSFAQEQKSELEKLVDRATEIARTPTKAAREEALGLFQQALARSEKGEGEPVLQRRIILRLARDLDYLGRYKEAVDYYTRAADLYRVAKDPEGLLPAIGGIARCYHALGDVPNAVKYYDEAIGLAREKGDRFQEGVLENNAGLALTYVSDFDGGLARLNKALAIRRELKDDLGIAYTDNAIGAVYYQIGEFQQALDAYNDALKLWRQVKNPAREADTLTNIGLVYDSLNQPRDAVRYYNLALPIWKTADEPVSHARTISNLGLAQLRLKEYAAASVSLKDALDRFVKAGDKRSVAYVMHNLADVSLQSGKPDAAIPLLESALEYKREAKDRYGEAHSLNLEGECYIALKRPDEAIAAVDRALTIRRDIGDRAGEAASLATLARAYREKGGLDEALKNVTDALDLSEKSRAAIAGMAIRTSWFASIHDWYDLQIGILMEKHRQDPAAGFEVQAFEASERSRARTLLDALAEEQRQIGTTADPALQAEARALARRLHSEMVKADAGQGSATIKVGELLDNWDQLQARIRKSDPHYSALQDSRVVSAQEARHMASAGTVLIEYFAGRQRTWAWAVSPTRISAYDLGGTDSIRIQVAAMQAALAESGRWLPSESLDARRARLEKSEAAFNKSSNAVSAILIRPLKNVTGARRLVIVAEGLLESVPFSALPDASGMKLLSETHEIVEAPSLSTVAVMREQVKNRKRAPHEMAIVADPVTAANDPRLAHAPPTRGTEWPRLTYAGTEATRIAASVPGADPFMASGFTANRRVVESRTFAQYRVVHFATHAFVSSERPEESGIVLSLFDREGKPVDGFLRLYEIYGLRWNADLVVLSACETAAGKDVAGEGRASLTRAFEFAGVPRVLATMWRIDDRATAEFMYQFYRALWSNHASPTAALQAAQQSVRSHPEWRSAWYWAGFTLNGDWL